MPKNIDVFVTTKYQNSDVIRGRGKRANVDVAAADDLSLRLRVRDHDHDLVVRRLRLLRSLHSLGLFNHDPRNTEQQRLRKDIIEFLGGDFKLSGHDESCQILIHPSCSLVHG